MKKEKKEPTKKKKKSKVVGLVHRKDGRGSMQSGAKTRKFTKCGKHRQKSSRNKSWKSAKWRSEREEHKRKWSRGSEVKTASHERHAGKSNLNEDSTRRTRDTDAHFSHSCTGHTINAHALA